MKEDILGAESMLQNRVHCGDRSSEILLVERDSDVDKRRVARRGIDGHGLAFAGIVEWRCLTKRKSGSGGADLAWKSEIAVEVRGSDGLGGGKRLEGWGKNYYHHDDG